MTCIKTGCHIFIEQYDEYAYGDAFEVGPFKTRDPETINRANRFLNMHPEFGDLVSNVAYFKIVRRSFKPINGLTVKHYTVHDFEEIIGSHGGEIEKDFWPPVVLITNNFTYHDHRGTGL